MAEMMTTDVRAIMDRTPFDVAAVADLREVLEPRSVALPHAARGRGEHQGTREEGKGDQARGPPPAGRRRGAAGPLPSGLEHLKKAGDAGMACFFRGLALENQQRYDQAADAFAPGGQAGYDPKTAELHRAGALRRAGQIDEAKKILAGLHEARRLLRRIPLPARLPARRRRRAGRGLRRVRKDAQPRPRPQRRPLRAGLHQRSLRQRRLALEYYRRCTDRPPVPLAAWINLGILYEDEMRFRDAEQCYRHVLAHEPNHPRARLFFKDCQASKGMYYDEEAERGYTVLKQLHEIPVTDFELSVRSRNCLRKMNIRTLGDLTRTTEVALLSSKNFGETSLAEIKEMMQAKGLRLGMSLEGNERAGHDHRVEQPQEVPPELQAILNKPIGDLNLSVRARKCMSKLNIQTVGDLLKHTGDELLECKNFGVTSLNEVREKLTALSLKLKND